MDTIIITTYYNVYNIHVNKVVRFWKTCFYENILFTVNNFEFINLTDENYRDYVDKPRLDIDSIVVGSENLETFGHHMSFYLMIARKNVHPGTQKKSAHVAR